MEAIRTVYSPRECVNHIVSNNGHGADSLIPILQDIQAEYHYLPEEALRAVAEILELPLIQVYGVATFFKAFSLKPKGRHQCAVCTGTACHVRGAGGVLEELERKLKIKSGDTTDDMEYSLETVNCVGACALGPMVIIDGEYYAIMNSAKVGKILKDHARRTAGRVGRRGDGEEEEKGAEKYKAARLSPKSWSPPAKPAKSSARAMSALPAISSRASLAKSRLALATVVASRWIVRPALASSGFRGPCPEGAASTTRERSRAVRYLKPSQSLSSVSTGPPPARAKRTALSSRPSKSA